MKKILFIGVLLMMAGLGFGSALDTLYFGIVDLRTAAPSESVMVLIDTSGALTYYDTLYTNASGAVTINLPITETYLIKLIKEGYYSIDWLAYSWENTPDDTLQASLKVAMTPILYSPSKIVITDYEDIDTLISFPESLTVALTRRSTGDTLYTGYCDSIGNFPFDYDSLTDGVAYKIYVDSDDTSFNSRTFGFTWDSGSKYKVIPVNMKTYSSATLNTITGYLKSMSGASVLNEVIRVSFPESPVYQDIGGTKFFFDTRPLVYRTDSNGKFEIKVPDTWINIEISNYDYKESFYCTGDTTLGTIGIR